MTIGATATDEARAAMGPGEDEVLVVVVVAEVVVRAVQVVAAVVPGVQVVAAAVPAATVAFAVPIAVPPAGMFPPLARAGWSPERRETIASAIGQARVGAGRAAPVRAAVRVLRARAEVRAVWAVRAPAEVQGGLQDAVPRARAVRAARRVLPLVAAVVPAVLAAPVYLRVAQVAVLRLPAGRRAVVPVAAAVEKAGRLDAARAVVRARVVPAAVAPAAVAPARVVPAVVVAVRAIRAIQAVAVAVVPAVPSATPRAGPSVSSPHRDPGPKAPVHLSKYAEAALPRRHRR